MYNFIIGHRIWLLPLYVLPQCLTAFLVMVLAALYDPCALILAFATL